MQLHRKANKENTYIKGKRGNPHLTLIDLFSISLFFKKKKIIVTIIGNAMRSSSQFIFQYKKQKESDLANLCSSNVPIWLYI